MKPVTRVRIQDSILEVELETTTDIPMDEMITKAEELLGRVKGKPIDEEDAG